ncbi:LysM peptidoglycan-binding domain-containing protein [Actinacidiphila acididurans]|uniref:Transglycosylase family protein n=1 Tax=Actinacidiphila acididurans TaxID=2784346 RepID=A0ABS2TNR7_9ACTN|nr:transglycosylase family protein [Actinacidiphila acididurans]MBM9504985.1 transglycosylase family protein [Actinacidiphila acididurans]
MLTSGNGRHRRPRQAPAAMVTVAATGAGIALPLLGAGAAHAADNSTWDKVAVCETGGLWSANTGNGFYGGLAITQDTWDEYGGGAYAKRPDLASRSEQIAVAEKILGDLGPNAWPGCESGTGLLEDSAPPSVDPGSTAPPKHDGKTTPVPPAPTYTPPPVPSAPIPGTQDEPGATPPSATPTTPATPSTPAAPTTPVTPTAPTGTVPGVPGTPPTAGTGPGDGSTASTTPGTPGAPTGPATPSDGAAGTPTAPSDGPSAGGRHAKPYSPTDEQLAAADRATRTEVYSLAGKPAGADTTDNANSSGKTGTSPSTGADSYTVGSGDSLSGIASAQHVDGGWRHLYDANHGVVGDDPNLIKPGQILNLG